MSGALLIAQERERQVDGEGWTPEHDRQWTHGELIRAALTYAGWAMGYLAHSFFIEKWYPMVTWPWDMEWFKPTKSYVRCLVKAGALLAAEIDRFQESEKAGKEKE